MGRDIKRKIFLIFFSPSGKYQVMMLRPSHNSVIEAEACVAAGFGAWHCWDPGIASTPWGPPSQPWAFRGCNLHEELLTDAGKCPLSEQL